MFQISLWDQSDQLKREAAEHEEAKEDERAREQIGEISSVCSGLGPAIVDSEPIAGLLCRLSLSHTAAITISASRPQRYSSRETE